MEWLAGAIPGLLVGLGCALMMLFMMRGMHGSHAAHGDEQQPAVDAEELARLRDEVAALRAQVGERDDAGTGQTHRQAPGR